MQSPLPRSEAFALKAGETVAVADGRPLFTAPSDGSYVIVSAADLDLLETSLSTQSAELATLSVELRRESKER